MSRKKKIFVLLGIIVMGFACIGISCKKKTYVDEYAYRESCIEKKREDFFNLMTECKNMFTYQQYEITLEKSYYDACAGEGCVLVSVKTNGTENFETDAFFDNKTGTLYFERTESGDWRYELYIINDEASFEIIDNSIYITAYVDVNNGTYYSKENKGIVLVDCEKENEEDKNCPGLSFPNNTVAKEIAEETGLQEITPLLDGIFAINVLTVERHIKKGQHISSHLHMDVEYLFEADDSLPLKVKEDENSAVGWIEISRINEFVTEEKMKPVYALLCEKMKNY